MILYGIYDNSPFTSTRYMTCSTKSSTFFWAINPLTCIITPVWLEHSVDNVHHTGAGVSHVKHDVSARIF